MATPTIVATGSTTPANSPAIAKVYIAGETITFTDPANPSPASRNLELISAPPGQTSTVQSPTTATPTLVLDSDPGTYRIRWTADGAVGELLIATLAANGERIPGYRERDAQDAATTEAVWNEAGNTEGYFPAMHSAIKAIGTDTPHTLGGAQHNADTLANLNAKISDATLIDTTDSRLSDARVPTSHGLGGTEHATATLAQLNAKVSDATLIDTTDSRLSDDRNDAAAVHDNVAGEISAITEKNPAVGTDLVLIEDSAAGNAKKRVQIANLGITGGGPGSDTTAIHDDTAGEINAVAAKATPVAADVILIEDSAAGFAKKKTTLTDLLGGGGSSGPIAAAQGDYMMVGLSADLTAAWLADDPVTFDQVAESRGSLVLDATTNVGRISGLKAGRTYMLTASLRAKTTPGHLDISWYNITSASYLGSSGRCGTQDAALSESGNLPAQVMFTPVVDTEVELRVSSFNPSTVDIAGGSVGSTRPRSWAIITEIGAVQADVVGGLEFMDIIEVTADQTSVSFGAAGDGAFQRALDGDVDETYFIEYSMPTLGVSSTYTLRPNGTAPANQVGQRLFAGGGAVAQSSEATMRFLTSSVDRLAYGSIDFQARTGQPRAMTVLGVLSAHTPEATSTIWTEQHAAMWNDDSTLITSMQVFCDVASGIKAGSRITLYRRTRSNLRADSAAVYERHAMETVDPGALATTERTTGHTSYGGSLVGVSLRVEDAVTAGDITVNVKLDGVTALTAVLDTTNSTSRVVRAPIGLHKFAADKNISVEFVPTSYDNTGSLVTTVTVQVHLTNDALINPPKTTQLESNLWYPPEVAHPDDDEFNSTVLDPSWTEPWTVTGDPIDPYAAFTTAATARRKVHTDHRPSWYSVQPAADSVSRWMYKTLSALPTNYMVWTRIVGPHDHQTIDGGDGQTIFAITADDGGGVDTSDFVGIYFDRLNPGGDVVMRSIIVSGGVNTGIETTLDARNYGQQLEYAAIQVRGSTINFWVAPASGGWVHLTEGTYSGAALALLGIRFYRTVTTNPGNKISMIDFVRRKDGIYLP